MYKTKNLIYFILYILLNPQLIKLVIKKIYLPVYIQFEWLKRFKIKTIIDVGAHKGKVVASLNYLFPKAKIYAFEPNYYNSKAIVKNMSGKNIIVENVAISDRSGKTIFFEYVDDSMSSLLEKKNEYYKNIKLCKKTSVKLITLDSYFNNIKLKDNVFLKIDTQGTEYQVLKGAKKFLKKVSLIHIELSFEQYYENQETFPKIYNYLTDNGFVYAGEAKESHFFPKFEPEGQINAIFYNTKLLSSFF